jgi:hypothetical protein
MNMSDYVKIHTAFIKNLPYYGTSARRRSDCILHPPALMCQTDHPRDSVSVLVSSSKISSKPVYHCNLRINRLRPICFRIPKDKVSKTFIERIKHGCSTAAVLACIVSNTLESCLVVCIVLRRFMITERGK